MKSRQFGSPKSQAARRPVRLGVEALEDRLVPAPLIALTTTNQLLAFDTTTPGTVTRTVAITGLVGTGETIVGIDYRPADGRLYGVSSASRLYALNPVTGAASVIGASGAFTLSGVKFGVDFNPVPDLLRVVSDADQNLRVTPAGGLAGTDTTLAYAAGDPGAGANPNIVEVAYTNSFAGATSTQLFGIDSNRDTLVLQLPPNAGTLNTIGSLGVDTTANVGFDIVRTSGNRAFAALNPTGTTSSRLYTIDLTTGAATLAGTIGNGTALVIGLASPLPQTSTVGGFDPATATWALRNAVGAGPADATFQYGAANWVGVVGDWNGDGVDTVGVVNPLGEAIYNNGNDLVWRLRNSNSPGNPTVLFNFGSRTWVPVVGDWDGDGITTVGAFDPATATWYLRNTNSAGAADLVFQYGGVGWTPVAGDWDGDGVDTVGVVDPTGQNLSATNLVWYLRNSNSAGAPSFSPFAFGSRTFRPVVGDWNGDTVDTVGAVDPSGGPNASSLLWYLRNSNSAGGVDFPAFAFAPRTYLPVSGDYNFPEPPTFV